MNDLLSCFLDSVPIVGNFKSGIELCTGRDAVTNEKLNGVDMVMNGVGLCLPLGTLGKLAKKGSKLKKVVKLAERVEKEYNNRKIKSAVDKIWREWRENEDEDE